MCNSHSCRYALCEYQAQESCNRVFFHFSGINGYFSTKTLSSDAVFAGGSFLFVAIFISFHTRSAVLGVLGILQVSYRYSIDSSDEAMAVLSTTSTSFVPCCWFVLFVWPQILLAFPLAFFMYRMVFQIHHFGTLQILAIYVILGIGADVSSVF